MKHINILPANTLPSEGFVKLPTVVACTGVGRSTIYLKVARGEFPKPVKLGARAVAWRVGDVRDWINQRVA